VWLVLLVCEEHGVGLLAFEHLLGRPVGLEPEGAGQQLGEARQPARVVLGEAAVDWRPPPISASCCPQA
jgi:hypothetical protein